MNREQDLTNCQEELTELEKLYCNALNAEMLGKSMEQLRDDYRNAEQLIRKFETTIFHLTQKNYMEKRKLEYELHEQKIAMLVALEKAEVLSSQLLSESSSDEQAIALFQFVRSAKISFLIDAEGNQNSASSLDYASTGQKVRTQQTKLPEPKTVSELSGMEISATSERKASSAIEDEISGDFIAQPTLTLKRITPPEPEILEGSVLQNDTNIVASPLHKRAKVSELYEITETQGIPEPSENPDTILLQGMPQSEVSEMKISQTKGELELDKLPSISNEGYLDTGN